MGFEKITSLNELVKSYFTINGVVNAAITA